MTPDEARDYLTRSRDAGQAARVVYRPVRGDRWGRSGEAGVITRVSGTWVFVRYGDAKGSQATDPADLELLARKDSSGDAVP